MAFSPHSANAQETLKICPNIILEVPETLEFTEVERQLMCDEVGIRPWTDIPPKQAEFFLRRFLEGRGYFNPEFRNENAVLHVKTNQISAVSEVILRNDPTGINPNRFWKIFGRPMTPAALNDLEKWLTDELGRRGYPCSKLTSKAFPKTGIIEVDINSGHKAAFVNPAIDPIPGMIAGLPKRYYAFQVGEEFNSSKLDLSSKRLLDSEVVVSSTFTSECSENGSLLSLHQHLKPGLPHIVSFGTGFDTEEFFIIEGSWKNTRMPPLGSNFIAAARASYRVQTARAAFDWYYAPIVTSHFVKTDFSYTRENELDYDTRESKVRTGPVWQADAIGVGARLWVAPSYVHTELARGVGEPTTNSLALDFNLALNSHNFEYLSANPSEGFEVVADVKTADKDLASDYTATHISVSATALHNVFRLDPAIWILGIRGSAATNIYGEGTTREDLPPNLLERLGGSSNLRGFDRKRLPRAGAVSSAYAGSELRVAQILPFGLQPIFFIDWGRFGMEPKRLDSPDFWSPGTGIHWRSPIGVVRGTLAHGLVKGPGQTEFGHLEKWHLYLSFGETF